MRRSRRELQFTPLLTRLNLSGIERMLLFSLVCAVLSSAALATSTGKATASAVNLITNGDFETGDFSGWSLFTTGNGTIGEPGVSAFDTNGNSHESDAARFNVGRILFIEKLQGGGIFQEISLPSSVTELKISADIASITPSHYNNLQGGLFSLLLDGVVIDSHDFGHIEPATTERAALSAVVTASAGQHEIRLLIQRSAIVSERTPFQYIDNVSALVPIPGALPLFLAALGGLALVGRHQNQRGR